VTRWWVLLALCSGCTHVVWYGRSDDRRHVASVLEQAGQQRVRFDMVDGPLTRGVAVEALSFSEGHVAYPAELDDGWAVFVDGVPGPRFESIGALVFRFPHVAYTGERAGRWVLVHDGREAVPTENVLPGSIVLGPARDWAWAAQDGREVFVVRDGKRGAVMDAVGQLQFSGARLGYVARRGGASFVVVDGVEGPAFEAVAELVLGPPDVVLARGEGKWRVFVDGVAGPAFDRIAGLNGAAYVGRRGREDWVVDGAREVGPFAALKTKLQRDGAGRLVFVGKRGDAWVVVAGQAEWGPWDEVEDVVLAGSHVGFIGARAGRQVVVLDGVERSTWEWASSLALSADGARVAHLARRDGETILVVDGQERRFDVVVGGTLAFSRDGRRFACVTGERAKKRLFITRDDGRRVEIDMEELAASLSRVAPESLLMSPDVGLLRRWVEAELEN